MAEKRAAHRARLEADRLAHTPKKWAALEAEE